MSDPLPPTPPSSPPPADPPNGAAPAPPPAPAKRAERPRLSRAEESRRQILRGAIATIAIALLQPVVWIPVVRRFRERLRPPGAIDEHHFLAACIKCGQCVQVCPVRAIHLAGAEEGLGMGAPYIDARSQACDFSCDALSCILACPTGALSHALGSKEEVRIGVARLVRPDACRARRGEGFRGVARGPGFEGRLRYEDVDRWTPVRVREHPYEREICDLCVTECPIGPSAIELVALDGDPTRRTPEIRDACTGCGVCEMICPVEPGCIEIEPRVRLDARRETLA